MKKIIVPFLLIITIGSCKKQIEQIPAGAVTEVSNAASPCTGNNWVDTPNWPFWAPPDFVVFGRIQFMCGNKIYVPADNNKMYIYDANYWSVIDSDNPVDYSVGFCFSIGDKGYVSVGGTGNGRKLWEYTPLTNSWQEKAIFQGAGRFFPSCFVIGNKAYVTCGRYGNCFNDLWEYSTLNDQWVQKASLPTDYPPRSHASAFAIGSKGYLVCGESDANLLYKTLLEYNPATNMWLKKADFPGPGSAGCTAFSIGNFGYAGTAANSFYKYSPASNSWIKIANYTGPGWQPNSTVTMGAKAYVLGDNDMTKYYPQQCNGTTP